MKKIGKSSICVLILLMCIGSIAFALIMQVYFDMQPCPLCILQRIAIVSIGLISLIGIFINHKLIKNIILILMVIIAMIGLGVAIKQIWVEAHPQVTSYICQVQMGGQFDGWPFSHFLELLFSAKKPCEEALYNLLGISFPIWSAMFFIILGILSAIGICIKKKQPSKN